MSNKIKFPTITVTHTKGLLIDLDNTLYSYDFSHQKAIAHCWEHYTKLDINISFQLFYQTYRSKRTEVTKRLDGQGACRSRLHAFQTMFEEWKIENAYNLAYEYELLYWNTFLNNMILEEDALLLLGLCKSNNITVCIVSDMQAHFQIQKINALGINQYIDYLVTSDECGVEKPNPLMFQTALKKLNLSPQDVIMVGDDYIKDVQGALNLGIKSFQVILI